MRTRATLLVLLLRPALSGGAVLAAQQASPYVPLRDWTMPYVEHLIAAGAIEDPSPLTRPLRRSDVLRAIAAADTGHLSPAVRATLRQLRAELGPDSRVSGARVRAAGALGVAAANYARRDPLSAIDSTRPAAVGPGTRHRQRRPEPRACGRSLRRRDPPADGHTPQIRPGLVRQEGPCHRGSRRGGVHRRAMEVGGVNPLNLGILEQVNNGGSVNSFVGLDFERHGNVTVFGQVLLDDIQIDRKTATDLKPSSYALTLGAEGRLGRAVGLGAWKAYYTRVTNLTYRNEDSLQIPLYHGLGTGRNLDDYDQLTLTDGLLPRAGMLLTPELTYLRQGEGDPRLPQPPVSAYPTTPTIFQGVVERTLQVALAGSYAVEGRMGLSFTAGVHRTTNFQHVAGDTRTRFLGSVGVSYRLPRQGPIP